MDGPTKSSMIGKEVQRRWFLVEHSAELRFGDLYHARDMLSNQDRYLLLSDEDAAEAFAEVAPEDYYLPSSTTHGLDGFLASHEVGTWEQYRFVVCEHRPGKLLTRRLDGQGVFTLEQAARIVAEVGLIMILMEESGLTLPYLFTEALIVGPDLRVFMLPPDLWPPLQLLDTDEVVTSHLYTAPTTLDTFRPVAETHVVILGQLLFHLLTGKFPYGGAVFEQVFHNMRSGKRRQLRDFDEALDPRLEVLISRCLDGEALDEQGRSLRPEGVGEFCLQLDEVYREIRGTPFLGQEESFILQETTRRTRLDGPDRVEIESQIMFVPDSGILTEPMRDLTRKIWLVALSGLLLILVMVWVLSRYMGRA